VGVGGDNGTEEHETIANSNTLIPRADQAGRCFQLFTKMFLPFTIPSLLFAECSIDA
jgi:hypothetical protein